MAKKDDNLHATTDRWARGRANPTRGTGAYTHSRTLTGTDPSADDNTGKVDRSDLPSKKPFGSFHYPATKEG